MNVGNSPGCMTVAKLTLSAGFNYDQEITGATACSGYDQTNVSGAVALNNATFNMTLSYVPSVGSTFKIINSTSLTGTFNNLVDGAVFVSGSSKLRINYSQTGATLTVVDPSTEVTATLGSPPATGLNTVLIMSLVATLLGLGALMLLVTRRRRLTTK
ncbi:MAG: hypothetical protein V9G25_08020 [Acidimicrobiia bacterium]